MVNTLKSVRGTLVMHSFYVKRFIMAWMLAFTLALGGMVPTHAQTPMPTLAISGAVSAMFSSANGWMVSLSDVLAIGFGISIAMALLGLVGFIIVSALNAARKSFGGKG